MILLQIVTAVNKNQLKIAQAIEPGNIDLKKRPKVLNPDGSYSTVRTIGIEIDGGRHVNIPTVIDGKVVSDDEAVKHFRKKRKHLGIYKTREDADTAAKQLHIQQEQYYGR